jgi:hypothetical protein
MWKGVFRVADSSVRVLLLWWTLEGVVLGVVSLVRCEWAHAFGFMSTAAIGGLVTILRERQQPLATAFVRRVIQRWRDSGVRKAAEPDSDGSGWHMHNGAWYCEEHHQKYCGTCASPAAPPSIRS